MIAEQILKAIRECLSPAGVAYVSYNVYPGWHLRGLVREILCRQTAASASPAARVQQARQYLDFLITHAPGSDSVYGSILKREKDILSKTPDTYLFHEHLEELNEPSIFINLHSEFQVAVCNTCVKPVSMPTKRCSATNCATNSNG